MIKKKTKRAAGKREKGKAKAKKGRKRTGVPRTKKAVNPAEVRKDIARIVGSGAKKMAAAVMEEAFKGQLAPTKYLLEVAGVYPPVTDGEQATQEEDCLAKTLLERLNIPKKPVVEEDEEPAGTGDVEAEEKAEGASDKGGDGKAEEEVGGKGAEGR
jgi:hypothetical protein